MGTLSAGNVTSIPLRELSQQTSPRTFFSFAEIFGNDHPVELELGCGKGFFLSAVARKFPEINFVGVDRGERRMRTGGSRFESHSLPNLRFFKFHAWTFLERFVALESANVFHIYFPDPWPKRRHRKRRLVDQDFLILLHERLQVGGHIEIATDDHPYFLSIQEMVSKTRDRWRSYRESVNQRLIYEEEKTLYEFKYKLCGKGIYYLELEK